jgi:hypothetical protein
MCRFDLSPRDEPTQVISKKDGAGVVRWKRGFQLFPPEVNSTDFM